MAYSYYKTTYRGKVSEKRLPEISTNLDSIRNNQFEIQFVGLGTDGGDLTLAAKQVQGLGVEVQDIEVRRLNDTIYYPGKATYTPLVVTFDNLALKNTAPKLWEVFKNTFNPVTGEHTGKGVSELKHNIRVLELSGDNDILSTMHLFGTYPTKIAWSDKVYVGESQFSTISVTFRYDYFNYTGKRLGV